MGKARWDIKLAFVLARKQYPMPLTKGGRPYANIKGHIKNFSLSHAHQFSLGLFELIMQPSQNASSREGFIVLDKGECDASLLIFLAAVGFEEIASFIPKDFRLQ